MSDSYVIEVRPPRTGRSVQAGIVVRDGGQFRFFAATDDFHALEGLFFKNPKAAEQAAVRLAALSRGQYPASAAILQPSR